MAHKVAIRGSYHVVAATEQIYRQCARGAEYGITEADRRDGKVKKTEEGEEIGVGAGLWNKDFNLSGTFSTWSQVTMLHLYLVYARVRNLDKDAAAKWQAQLTDHFFFDAEARMDITHQITQRGLRQKYLKDLFIQWRGIIVAYDEGVIKGDAVLAAAVWRNLFKAREDVDVRSVAAIVSWMRLCLKRLDEIPDDMLAENSMNLFSWAPTNEFIVVDKPTPAMQGYEFPQTKYLPRRQAESLQPNSPLPQVSLGQGGNLQTMIRRQLSLHDEIQIQKETGNGPEQKAENESAKEVVSKPVKTFRKSVKGPAAKGPTKGTGKVK